MLTQQRLKELFYYDSENGNLIRKVTRSQGLAGTIGGCSNGIGYLRLVVDGKHYYAHRLVWLYVYGEWPKNSLDHIDHNIINNKISNLRDITQAGNMQNQIKARKDNKSTGVLGVYKTKKIGVFRSMIQINGKSKFIGSFKTIEDAKNAYITAKRELHENCTI